MQTLIQNLNKYEIAFGYDISEEDLKIARKNLEGENVNLILGYREQLPFLDSEFDLVTISNSLHHIENIDNMINEAIRVLKRNGLLLINEVISNNLTEPQLTHKEYHHMGVKVDKLLGKYNNFTFTDNDIKAFFMSNSSRIKLVEEYIHEENKTEFIDKEEIQIVSRVIDNRLDRISHLQEYEIFLKEGEKIKDRLREVGIQRPKHILLLYKKLQ